MIAAVATGLLQLGMRLADDNGIAPTTQDVDPNTGHGAEWGEAAPIGLLVIVLLCVAGYFLARSFSKNMKRVPASFDPPDEDPQADGSAPAVPAVGDPATGDSGPQVTAAASGPEAGSAARQPPGAGSGG